MTSQTFVRWLQHFNRYKSGGECLLIMDGAKCHLNYSTVEAAEDMAVTLLCLPSNTTHELQPMDKSVFGPFEKFWDNELMNFWSTFEDCEFNNQQFGYVFTPLWDKSATPKNVKAGFEACGISLLNPNRILEQAFAPSQTIELPRPVSPVAGPSHTDVLPQHLPEDGQENETVEPEDDSSAWDSEESDEILQPSRKRKNVSFTDILSSPNTKITSLFSNLTLTFQQHLIVFFLKMLKPNFEFILYNDKTNNTTKFIISKYKNMKQIISRKNFTKK